jgi:DNA-binding Lrp family transcriptional regulator
VASEAVILHNVCISDRRSVVNMPSHELDALDASLIATLHAHPRVGLLEISRRLGVARGTVTARLQKLQSRGVITGFGPELDPARMGFPVLAFVSLEIAQGRLDDAVELLRGIPEVLEAHGVTGTQDLLCRVVARDNGHLQEIINAMVSSAAVRRSTSSISMSRQIAPRVEPLVRAAAR